MLHLQLPTEPAWADLALRNLEDILVDHLYCEQKAASNAISMIVRYPERTALVDTLADVVAEEWEHYRRVLAEIRKRGFTVGPQRVDEYAVRLLKFERKGERDKQLLDKLLVCAIIEARSCERFKVLSQTVEDPELAVFYRELMESEAGHYTTFTDLARVYYPAQEVADRLQACVALEKEIVETLTPIAGRIHQ